jgi:hypothetical protein
MSPAMLARIGILEKLAPEVLAQVIANAERVIAERQSIIAAAKKARKNQRLEAKRGKQADSAKA